MSFASHDAMRASQARAKSRHKMPMRRAAVWTCVRRTGYSNNELERIPGKPKRQPDYSRIISFMMAPAAQTVRAGLEANGFQTMMGNGPFDLLKSGELERLGAGDVFVWVGVGNLEWKLDKQGSQMWVRDALRNMTAKGVFTVFYSTESYLSMACAEKRMLPVREIWEYTQSNVHCCPDDPAAARVRYVPPGYVPRGAFAGSNSPVAASAKPPRLVFFGSGSPWYWLRNKCRAHVTEGLAAEWARGEEASASAAATLSKQCVYSGCTMCNSSYCPMQNYYGIDTDAAWDKVVGRQRYYLNVHKACSWGLTNSEPVAPSNASCESFRLASLLSAGAEVFSEHCHPADEAAYEGFVRFLPIDDVPAAVYSAWRAAQSSSSRDQGAKARAEHFARRFAPAAIFERAGLPAVLSAHREGRLDAPSLPSLTRYEPELAESIWSRFPAIPSHCCVTFEECKIANMRTNKPKRQKPQKQRAPN